MGAYVLLVLSSATDESGNSVAPLALILVAGVVNFLFYIMATVRLWKIKRGVPLLLILFAVAPFILQSIQVNILLNILKIENIIVYFWAISMLWRSKKQF